MIETIATPSLVGVLYANRAIKRVRNHPPDRRNQHGKPRYHGQLGATKHGRSYRLKSPGKDGGENSANRGTNKRLEAVGPPVFRRAQLPMITRLPMQHG